MAEEREGTFGSYVPNAILDQIDIRQKIHSRKLPDGTADAERLYQTEYHNAPWVCLRSSVDVPIEEYKPGTKPPTDGGALAKQFILCGGTMQLTGTGKNAKLSFVGNNNLSAVGYGLDSTYGYRPRPGITKVQVKTKDTFGCIMEATVNFTIYSLDDLEAVDKLYFKPGMSALLEWGHSEYVCNNAKLYSATKARLFDLEGFFNNQDSYEEVNEKLQNWRASSQFDGNYEAMFGLVTNFSWSFNNDGSYSCTVKLLSQGTILEGLQVPAKIGFNFEKIKQDKVRDIESQEAVITKRMTELAEEDKKIEKVNGGFTTARQRQIHREQTKLLNQLHKLYTKKQEAKGENLSEKKAAELEYSQKSPFHWIFMQMLNKVRGSSECQNNWAPGTYTYSWPDGQPEDYNYYGRMVLQEERWWILKDQKSPVAFIKLNDLLRIFNQIFNTQAQNLKIGFTKFETRDDGSKYSEQAFLTFSEHFSLKPNEVLLPFRPSSKDESSTFFTIKDGDTEKFMTLNEVLNRLAVVQAGTLASNKNRIGDILVEVNFILGCLDAVLDNEQGTYNVRDFIDKLLSGIQAALGNVNDFGIHIDHTTETVSIVDRRCISHNEYGSEVEKKIIIASGPQTTLTELHITSEVSPEIASEMSIAATAPANGKSIDRSNPNQVFWNEGCVDRHRLRDMITEEVREAYVRQNILNSHPWTQQEPANYVQAPDSGNSVSKIFADAGDFFNRAIRLYGVFNGDGQEASTAEWSCIQQDGQVLFNSCIVRDLTKAGTLDKATKSYLQSGIIPIKIGFTMKGIGRFVVGNTFKISKGFVPDKYKEWRQLITGVEHNIDKSGWKTTVTALYYPVLPGTSGNIRPNLGSNELGWSPTPLLESMGLLPSSGPEVDNVYDVQTTPTPPKNAVEKFFKEYWKSIISQPGVCAGYVASMAKSWIGGKVIGLPGGMGNAGDTMFAPNAVGRTSVLANRLVTEGWRLVEEKYDTTAYGVKTAITKATEPGDIVIYYNQCPDKTSKYYHQHAQMKVLAGLDIVLGKGRKTKDGQIVDIGKTKTITSGWTTSTFDNYGCSFVYSNANPDAYKWDVFVLRAPKLNWK